MNDRLLELYRGVAVHATADLEHIAALELLALVMAADRTLSPSEIEAIRDISSEWRDDTTENSRFERYLGPAVERAQAAIADDSIVELIDDIDGRISSRVLRMALFSAAREVAGVDDGISPEEGTILAEVAVRFG
ncbi:MAG: TerB family tellurite resistance protein [Ilumatobacteraceae bacterium]